MIWFKIPRGPGPCATDGCINPVDWRMEKEGIGENYCVNCHAQITQSKEARAMKTINDLIVNGDMAQDYLRERLGYDTARFQSVNVADDGELRFFFDLQDDFQANLPIEMRYKCGYMTSIRGDDFWKRLEAWPNREQRELTILSRKATALDADLDKIRSAQVHAFISQMMPTIEELRRQITFNETTEIE